MRDLRERSSAVRGPLAAGPERHSAGKAGCALAGGGGASSGKLKVFETKKEKNKRRLIMSDSESDDSPVLPHRQRAGAGSESVDVKGYVTSAGKMQVEGSVKNGKKGGVSLKRLGQRDVVKYRQDGSINLKSSVCLGMERKRSRETLQNGINDDTVPLKRIKMESLKCGKVKRGETDEERMRLDSVRCGVGKSLIRVSRLPGPRQVITADERSESFSKKRMQADLKGGRSHEDEKSSFSEQSDQKMYRSLKHNIPSSSTQHYSVSSDGTSLRLQGKGGVLRLLPNNKKFVGQSASHFEGESDESRKSPGSSGGAYRRTFSEARKSHRKSGSSSVTDEAGKRVPFSGGADRYTRHLSLSEGRKSLKKAGYFSITEKSKRSPGHSGFTDQIIPKQLSLYRDRKCLKKRDSLIKEEKIKDPNHSGRAVKAVMKQHAVSEDRISLKRSGSSASEDTRKYSGRSSCIATLSEDRKPLKDPGCSSQPRKSHVGPKGKALKLKEESDSQSPQRDSKSEVNLGKRTVVKDREAGKFISESLVSPENSTPSEKIGRRTEKQQLRDQIKSMLLDAGWKIDMRPRKGRNYVDAVYVSPQGSGYWSITKAYSVFQEQCNKNDEVGNEEGKKLHDQPFKESSTNDFSLNGVPSQFSAIPSEVLKILKRNVVQKRRRRIEEDERDNGKRVTSSKSAKNRKKINANGTVGSSRKKNKNGRGCILLARTSNAEADSEDDGYVPYTGKRSVLAWMIDSGTAPENGKVKYMNRRRTRIMLEGLITRDGIQCSCCSKLLTVSKFEIHAGSKLNQPYANIFVKESGASLLQCQLDAWDKQKESDRCAFHSIDITDDDPNDDTCAICGDGGDLICCDSCPSTFHLGCLGIQMLPPGDWNCMNCLCRYCGVANSSTTEGNGVTSSSLLLSCGQCEGKYHQACIPEGAVTPVDGDSSSFSFCGQNCRMLFEHLQNLLGVKNDLDAGFSWTLVRRFDDELLTSRSNLAQRAECNSKIAVALDVMNECFLRIIDRRSGINLIHNVLYNRGSNFSRLSYSGFYTFILERGDEIISAASIRIHGTRLAEMPFIGTRDMYRRQGMCRRLLNVIEGTLGALKVEKLVIPAISELTHTWTMVFGFKPLDDLDKREVKSMNMLVFPDTGLLQKALLGQESNITKEGGLEPIENDSAMVTNGSSDLHTSNDRIVSCSLENRDEIEIKRPASPSSNNSVQETIKVSCQPSDAPLVSDTVVLRFESSETAPDGTSSVDHNVDKPCKGGILSAGSHIEPKNPKNQLSSDGSIDDAQTECQDNHATHPRFPTVGKFSRQDSLDVSGESLDPSILIQKDSERTLHTTSGHTDILSENRSEETHHNNSDVADESSLPPVLCKTPVADEATVLDTQNNEGEVSASADNVLNHNFHHIPARVSSEATSGMPCADSFEPRLHRSDDVALHDTGSVELETTMIKHDIGASHEDPKLCSSETFADSSVSERKLQNAHEINNERPVREHIFDVDDESLGAASKHDLRVPQTDQPLKISDNSSDATHALTLDACKHNLHGTQKDLHAVISPSEFCPSYEDNLVDKHAVETCASVLSNHHTSIEEYKCCTAEVIKPNGSVPGDRFSF